MADYETQPVMSTTMVNQSMDVTLNPPINYGSQEMPRRWGPPQLARSPKSAEKGYERSTQSWSRSMTVQVPVMRQPKMPPTANPDTSEPLTVSHKTNISEQNKDGVTVADRKHRGVSRNVLGGFYTS